VVDIRKAVDFIKKQGDRIELARLVYLIAEKPPPANITKEFQAAQRPDGGWAAFWAGDYSSLDATCFRFSQAEQLGLHFDLPWIQVGLDFLANRQREDNSWEEDHSVKALVPPWLKLGELSCKLYLTSNCGFWLGWAGGYPKAAEGAATYLCEHLDENGYLPSFPHTHWLAAGLWYRLGMQEPFNQVQGHLVTILDELTGSNLAWQITTLRIANISRDNEVIQRSISRLVGFQRPDGSWGSDDGEGFDVHTTLESLYALKLYGISIR
jgi:squalene cyclase